MNRLFTTCAFINLEVNNNKLTIKNLKINDASTLLIVILLNEVGLGSIFIAPFFDDMIIRK